MLDRLVDADLKRRLVDARVGGDEAEHGRHVGMDHPRALGHATDGDFASVHLEAHREFLATRVAGHDRLRRVFAALMRQLCYGLVDSLVNERHGQPGADAPGGTDQPFLRFGLKLFRRMFNRALGIGDSADACAGIRATGVDHDTANFAFLRVLHGKFDGRGLDQIRGKRRRHFRGNIRNDESQVLFAARFDSAGYADRLKALGRGNSAPFENFGFHKSFYSRPAFSSSPQARLAA